MRITACFGTRDASVAAVAAVIAVAGAFACGGLTSRADPCRGADRCGVDDGCTDLSAFKGAGSRVLDRPVSGSCFLDCGQDAASCPSGTVCKTVHDVAAPGHGVYEPSTNPHDVCVAPGDIDDQ